MRSALALFSMMLFTASSALAQNPAQPDLDPANNPQIQKELGKIHDELSNMLRQQADIVRTITPNAGIIPLGGVRQTGNQLYGSGRTGLALVNLTEEQRRGLPIESDVGVLVKDVFVDTPAAAAGYKPGDVLIQFNGSKVPSDLAAFMGVAAFVKNDVPVQGTVLRDDKKVEMSEMRLADRRVVPVAGELMPCTNCPRPSLMNPASLRTVSMGATGPSGPTVQRFDGVKDVTNSPKQ